MADPGISKRGGGGGRRAGPGSAFDNDQIQSVNTRLDACMRSLRSRLSEKNPLCQKQILFFERPDSMTMLPDGEEDTLPLL